MLRHEKATFCKRGNEYFKMLAECGSCISHADGETKIQPEA